MSTGERIYVCWIALVNATVARPKQSSLSSRVAPRRPPLRKPQPVCTITAMRAVAPAADEVDTRSPPRHVVWKPCCNNWLWTAVRLHSTSSWLVAPCRESRWNRRRYSSKTTISSTAFLRSLGASQNMARKPPYSTVCSCETKCPIWIGLWSCNTNSGYRTATMAL